MSDLKKYSLQPNIRTLINKKWDLRIKLEAANEELIRLKQQGAPSKIIGKYLSEKISPIRSEMESELKSLVEAEERHFAAVKLKALKKASAARLNILVFSVLTLLISILLGWYFSKKQINSFFKLEWTISNLEKSKFDLEKKSLVLKQAIHSIDKMVGVISHELKNPLAHILLIANLIEKILPKEESLDKVKSLVGRIDPSIQRMNQLVSDLLDVTQIESNALKVESKPSQLAEIVQDVIGEHKASAQENNIELRTDILTAYPLVSCDPERTIQILSNLVNNAIKFTSSGGSVSIHAEKLEHAIEVQVTDTGNGIREEDLPHVFDRFWQKKDTAYIGTGLGLTIVKGLVESQGGQAWVKSKLGTGTTFYFTIPLAGI